MRKKTQKFRKYSRIVWNYQSGNQNPYIAEGQTTRGQKTKGPQDNQRSAKHTHKTKDRVTRVTTGSEFMCSRRVGSHETSLSQIPTSCYLGFLEVKKLSISSSFQLEFILEASNTAKSCSVCSISTERGSTGYTLQCLWSLK